MGLRYSYNVLGDPRPERTPAFLPNLWLPLLPEASSIDRERSRVTLAFKLAFVAGPLRGAPPELQPKILAKLGRVKPQPGQRPHGCTRLGI